jgi:ribose transport system permease protein
VTAPAIDLQRQTWLWPAAASAVLIVFIVMLSEEFRVGILTANLAAASFLALVGIGQMFPVASGEGGIDLSIPFVMNFCAFLAVKLISTHPASVVVVLLASIAFGVLVGTVNGLVVVRFRIPPIIGTLAVGFVVLTLVQIISIGGDTTFDNRTVTNLIRSNLFGIPTPFFFVVAIGGLAALLVRRTPYGRALLAVGQSRRAAFFSGIAVRSTVLVAFVISGALAGMTGALLAASVGSADMELGNPFLLTSVGAVVLGGNRIAGGTMSVVGTVFGALLLTLLVAAVTVAGLPIEAKNIASGLVITLVLVMANAPEGEVRTPLQLRNLFKKEAR